MIFSKDGVRDSAEAALAVVAVGWVANTAGLGLAMAASDRSSGLYGLTRTYGPQRHISSPLGTSQVACCWSHDPGRFRGGHSPCEAT